MGRFTQEFTSDNDVEVINFSYVEIMPPGLGKQTTVPNTRKRDAVVDQLPNFFLGNTLASFIAQYDRFPTKVIKRTGK